MRKYYKTFMIGAGLLEEFANDAAYNGGKISYVGRVDQRYEVLVYFKDGVPADCSWASWARRQG